jgi:hypothetical protein
MSHLAGVEIAATIRLTSFVEALQRVIPHRLEHREAGLVAGGSDVPDEALVDKRTQRLEQVHL